MPTEDSRSPRFLRTDLVAMGGRLVERLLRSRIPQMAAALSYRTIFSLIPMLVVGLVVLKAFTTEEDMARLLQDSLDYAGLSQIAVSEEAREAPGVFAPDAAGRGDEDGAARAGGAEAGEQEAGGGSEGGSGAAEGGESGGEGPAADGAPTAVDEWIEDRVQQITQIKLGAVGVFGVVLLIYAAISMLVEVERAFNQLTHASTGRAWHKRIMQYWTVLTLGTLLLLATFYVGQRFTGLVASLTGSGGQFLVAGAGYVATVAISTLLLLFLYVTMPNTRVRVRPAMAGAILAALLWEAGKWGFTQYVQYSAGFSRLYGSLALVPLFLLWVYVTWIIVLFGLHVAWAIQTRGSWLHPGGADARDEPMIVDPASILRVAGVVAGRFRAGGRPIEAGEVAEACGLPERAVEAMLLGLVRAGVVHRLDEDDEGPGFVLARSPEGIAAAEVLRVGEGLSAGPRDGAAGGDARADLAEARGRVLAGRSLADLVGRSDESGDAAGAKPIEA